MLGRRLRIRDGARPCIQPFAITTLNFKSELIEKRIRKNARRDGPGDIVATHRPQSGSHNILAVFFDMSGQPATCLGRYRYSVDHAPLPCAFGPANLFQKIRNRWTGTLC